MCLRQEEALTLGGGLSSSRPHGTVSLCAPGHSQTLSTTHCLRAPPNKLGPSQKGSPSKRAERRVQEGCALTEELGGAGAGGLLIVGEPLVDDLAHGRIQALQLLVLGGHAGSACNRSGTVGPRSGWRALPGSDRH